MGMLESLGICTKRQTALLAQGWIGDIFMHEIMQVAAWRQVIQCMSLHVLLRRRCKIPASGIDRSERARAAGV